MPEQHDGRSVASTVCHETSQNVTVRPFLLAISEVGWANFLFKGHSKPGSNQRDEDAHDFFVKQMPVVSRSKTSTRGVRRSLVLPELKFVRDLTQTKLTVAY